MRPDFISTSVGEGISNLKLLPNLEDEILQFYDLDRAEFNRRFIEKKRRLWFASSLEAVSIMTQFLVMWTNYLRKKGESDM